jgi:L-alanine-DL-glutamate epimerase-like enolase superfamily enzyme
MFRIKRVDAVACRVPFSDLYDGPRNVPQGWRHFDMVLVRAETGDGVVGWGESFAYSCLPATCAAVSDMVAPLAVGRDVEDIPAFSRDLQQRLHIQGRYGITIFAISGLDIALWDIAAQHAGVSLAEYLGGALRTSLPTYASLVRYGDRPAVNASIRRAAGEGYPAIKLHEPAYENAAEAREAAGPSIHLMNDVNCAWTEPEAAAMIARMRGLDLHWIEEPVFPPEDYDALARLGQFGVPIAAGENACTAVEFSRLIPAVTYSQPSVIKVGGVSEFLAVAAVAGQAGKTVMPHSPYFGPGYWATLHLAAHLGHVGMIEFLYTAPEAWTGLDIPLPRDGAIALPSRPGIGFAPDTAAIDRYRID